MLERLYPGEKTILDELMQPLMEFPWPSETKVYSTPRRLNAVQIKPQFGLYGRLANKGLISMTPLQNTYPPHYNIEITPDGAKARYKELVPRPKQNANRRLRK